MDREEIFGQLTEVFRDIFDDDSIELTDETTAADIEDWNSFTHITLISDIEDAFGIRFGMKDVVGLKNVGEMADLIEKLSTS